MVVSSAIIGLMLTILVVSVVPSLGQTASLTITQISILNSDGRIRSSLRTGEEFWVLGIVKNIGAGDISFSWTMTLDGIQISYEAWTLPVGKLALLTNISSVTAVMGVHSLTLTLILGSQSVQSTTQIIVR